MSQGAYGFYGTVILHSDETCLATICIPIRCPALAHNHALDHLCHRPDSANNKRAVIALLSGHHYLLVSPCLDGEALSSRYPLRCYRFRLTRLRQEKRPVPRRFWISSSCCRSMYSGITDIIAFLGCCPYSASQAVSYTVSAISDCCDFNMISTLRRDRWCPQERCFEVRAMLACHAQSI